MVVRRPARQLEHFIELLARQRLRREGLVGAAGPDRGLDVHGYIMPICVRVPPISPPDSTIGGGWCLPAAAPAEEYGAAAGEQRGPGADPDRCRRWRAAVVFR